jgi:hypothetical protein
MAIPSRVRAPRYGKARSGALFTAALSYDIVGNYSDVAQRYRDMRPMSDIVAQIADEPEAYERADRMTADPMPRGGVGPGYVRYQRRARTSKKQVVIASGRPAHPRIREAVMQRVARAFALYGLTGQVPTPSGLLSGSLEPEQMRQALTPVDIPLTRGAVARYARATAYF